MTWNFWLVVSYVVLPGDGGHRPGVVEAGPDVRAGGDRGARRAIAAARLLSTEVGLLFRYRVPTRAATSAAFWHWVRETASIPRSTARRDEREQRDQADDGHRQDHPAAGGPVGGTWSVSHYERAAAGPGVTPRSP